VANAFDLPVFPAAVDNVLSVFGPVAPDEIDRVLSPTGAVVVAAPGPDHLVELKSAFLAEARPHQTEPPLVGDGRFRVTASRRVRFGLQLDAAEVADLWNMTPYRWQVPAGRQVSPEAMAVTADFLVTRLERP
jgi:23S rRNA (guanine745-N1)-methyltransferase